MSEPMKRTIINPKDYSPPMPEILNMASNLCSEKIIKTVTIEGVEFTILDKAKTLYAGSYSEAIDNTSEPAGGNNENYHSIKSQIKNSVTPNCMICHSINYTTQSLPCALLHCQETTSTKQDDGIYVYEVPASLYIKVKCTDEAWILTKKLTGEENPEYHLAPLFGLMMHIFCNDKYGYEHTNNSAIEYYYDDGSSYAAIPVKKRDKNSSSTKPTTSSVKSENTNSKNIKKLKNIHNLLTYHLGQNYIFNGCMAYLMECINEKTDYDYYFFSDMTGDSFTQLYSDEISVSCLSDNTDCVQKAFDACGYNFIRMSIDDTNRDEIFFKIKENIHNGIPIISKGYGNNSKYCVICGYNTEGNNIYILQGGSKKEVKSDFSNFATFIFLGDKKETPELATLYRNLIMDIPKYITKPSQDRIIFGRQAFVNWAESLLDGRYDNIPASKIDRHRCHTGYLINAGTNGCSRGALKRAYELNPDMDIIPKLQPCFEKNQQIFDFMAYSGANHEGMEGGLHILPKTIKDKEKMKPISDKIFEFVDVCDEILALY